MIEYAYCDCCQLVEFTFTTTEPVENADDILDPIANALINYMKDNNVNYQQVNLVSCTEEDGNKYNVVLSVDLRINGQVDPDLDEDIQNFYSTTDFGIPDIQTRSYVPEYLGTVDLIDPSSIEITVDDIDYGEEVVCDGTGDVYDDDFDLFTF